MKTPGAIVLADGTRFSGISVGVTGQMTGEVVFNTSQTGYQEIISDPSYSEQIIVFTQPHIGNVGVNPFDMESKNVFAAGVIMRSFSSIASNWRAEGTLGEFFQQHNVIAISEIDTRALTHHLRDDGSQAGTLMGGEIDWESGIYSAQCFSGLLGKDLATRASSALINPTKRVKPFVGFSGMPKVKANQRFHVIVMDFGVKHSIIRHLTDRDCRVSVVPANATYQAIMDLKPHGIVLSNGPGDPAACKDAIATIKLLLTQRIPIMAICLGHQLLALACGARTQKMVFGHHGANHPIVSTADGTVSISSQNHGFVVSEESLPKTLRITHRSLFDNTIAGIAHKDLPAFGFQGHPEANPGPLELTQLFDEFINVLAGCYA